MLCSTYFSVANGGVTKEFENPINKIFIVAIKIHFIILNFTSKFIIQILFLLDLFDLGTKFEEELYSTDFIYYYTFYTDYYFDAMTVFIGRLHGFL